MQKKYKKLYKNINFYNIDNKMFFEQQFWNDFWKTLKIGVMAAENSTLTSQE